MEAATPDEVIYRLDADDNIVWVNERWNGFAAENGAPHLAAPAILGRSLWDFVSGDEVRHLSRALLHRARQRAVALRVPFRCDAPELRRFMEMDLHLRPDDRVEFRCTVRDTARRDPVALLDPTLPREGTLLRMCSWCRRVDLGGDQWVEVEAAIRHLGLFEAACPPPITHTICPRDLRLLDDANP